MAHFFLFVFKHAPKNVRQERVNSPLQDWKVWKSMKNECDSPKVWKSVDTHTYSVPTIVITLKTVYQCGTFKKCFSLNHQSKFFFFKLSRHKHHNTMQINPTANKMLCSLLYSEVMCNNCHSAVLLWVLRRGQACLLSTTQ